MTHSILLPRVKFEHRPVRLGDSRVRIGGVIPGIAADIADPDGWIWHLLTILDGSRTINQIVTEIIEQFPCRDAYDVRVAIDELVGAGYLEDAGEPAPRNLTQGQQERYSRSRLLFQWMDRGPRETSWDAQLLLRNASVAVIGLGGVGCTAALALTMSGLGRVHCVEPDFVELSNLNRQILYTEDDLGRPKVDVAVHRLGTHNSDVTVTGELLTITDPDSLRGMAAKFDVLLLAADQPGEIRSWTNAACHAAGTAWVHGGYHGPLVTIGLYSAGAGPCYDCGRKAELERRATLPSRSAWKPGLTIKQPHAANVTTAGIAGHLAAHATIRMITAVPGFRTNCEYGFNLVTLEDSYALGPRSPVQGCPTCGT